MKSSRALILALLLVLGLITGQLDVADNHRLFQTSTLQALMAGGYDGDRRPLSGRCANRP
jgi:hypothetical protein